MSRARTTQRRAQHALAAATCATLVVLVVGALAGCAVADRIMPAGGPADPDGAEPNDSPFPVMGGDDCPAEVEVSGDAQAAWEGHGVVSMSDTDLVAPATYQSSHGDAVLTVYSDGHGMVASAVLTMGETSYGVTGSEAGEGLDVDPDGSGAVVDIEAVEVNEDGGTRWVRLLAEFDC